MAIKTSTIQKIQAVMNGHDDWACVGSYYSPWWKETCICGHAIKEVYVVGHADDHGPAFSLPTFKIGSECFKFIAKDPKFAALSADLQAKRLEIAKIQRRMKREREDVFHASPEWQALATRLNPADDIFWMVLGHGNHLRRLDVVLDRGLVVHVEHQRVLLSKLNRGDLRFQDLETAQEFVVRCETLVTKIVEELRPHAVKIQERVKSGFRGLPGWSGLKAVLDKP